MNFNKSGRRCSTADASVQDRLHCKSAPPVIGSSNFANDLHVRAARPAGCGFGDTDLTFDTSAALTADISALTEFNLLSEAVNMKPEPASSGTKFRASIENWENEGDKRIRRGQGWRVRFKYIGMLLRDEDEEELRRVIGVVWHSGTASDAGWALETQLGGSHTNRSTYHTLASEGEGANERCTLFDMITPDDNGHIEFERERETSPLKMCNPAAIFGCLPAGKRATCVHRLCE